MPFTLETVYQAWDDEHGERVEVGTDRDGLDLVEVRSYSVESKPVQSIMMQPEQARMVAESILKVCDELEKAKAG
jgi:hypothetical protein